MLKQTKKQAKRVLSHSQNFFKTPETVKNLIKKTNLSKSDTVLEIGPGRGAITDALLVFVKKIIVIEIDSKLFEFLQKKYQGNGKIKLISGDFLKWKTPKEKYKIFANIPFNTTADIIKKITHNTKLAPIETYLVVQKQAAKKYINKQTTRHDLQSILLFPDYEVNINCKISRKSFVPTPRIPIVLLEIIKRKSPLISDKERQLFRDFVVYGYTNWKKDFKTTYLKIFTNTNFKQISKEINLNKTKAVDFSFDEWKYLFEVYLKHTSPKSKEIINGSESKLIKQQSKLKKSFRTRRY